MKIPKTVKYIAGRLAQHGRSCYVVGGSVRDQLLGQDVADYDLATDAQPEEVQKIFPCVIPTGIQHGTVTIQLHGRGYEITTFRTDGPYRDGRRPESVAYHTSIEEDLKRRDFTINAMAYDLRKGRFIDPTGGVGDLKKSLLRCVGDPHKRLSEDGLRAIRACRFASQLEFQVDPALIAAISKVLDKVALVAKERIARELTALFERCRYPSVALKLFQQTELLSLLFPELQSCIGVPQEKNGEPIDLFDHLLYSCDAAPPDQVLRWAALLHDVGKPQSYQEGKDGQISFHRHESLSAEIACQILGRYRFSNSITQRVTTLISFHMVNYQESWSDGAVRRFIRNIGKENWQDLLQLQWVDCRGTAHPATSACPPRILAFKKRIETILESEDAISLKDLAIDGNTLHEKVGIPKSPLMGVVLNFLLEATLEDPAVNTKERLLKIAKNFYQTIS